MADPDREIDKMVAVAQAASGLRHRRVIGEAGVLNTARWRTRSASGGRHPDRVEGIVLGSPGETVVAIPSLTKFDGTPLPESLSDSEIASIIGADPRLRVGDHCLSHGRVGLAADRRRGDPAGDRRGLSCGASGHHMAAGRRAQRFLRGSRPRSARREREVSSYRSPGRLPRTARG